MAPFVCPFPEKINRKSSWLPLPWFSGFLVCNFFIYRARSLSLTYPHKQNLRNKAMNKVVVYMAIGPIRIDDCSI